MHSNKNKMLLFTFEFTICCSYNHRTYNVSNMLTDKCTCTKSHDKYVFTAEGQERY